MTESDLCVLRSREACLHLWQLRPRHPRAARPWHAPAPERPVLPLIACETRLLRRIAAAHHSAALGRIAERAVAAIGAAVTDGGR